ncbi:MAG: hypothetical protein AAF628_11850 [Planctomycetota bacterium]
MTSLGQQAELGAAYAAKVAASATFLSGRSLDAILAEEFALETAIDRQLRPLLSLQVDAEHGAVTARVDDDRWSLGRFLAGVVGSVAPSPEAAPAGR